MTGGREADLIRDGREDPPDVDALFDFAHREDGADHLAFGVRRLGCRVRTH